ncbi:DUF1800 domain-containing protein [Alteromonas sediminis]|nr:DUF1800 domain-containing protein [Alteromonas sediminis]
MAKWKLIILALGAVTIAACGGGSSDSSTTPSEPAPIPTTPPPPPPPPPEPEPTLEEKQRDAARLLNQATFGARLTDIETVVEIGVESWISQQFALPVTSAVDTLEMIDETKDDEELYRHHRVNAWWQSAVYAQDQLRQRVAFALSQIMVVSDRSSFGNDHYGMVTYYDVLVSGAFGNFRDLLEDVTLSPAMGMYLSMLGNEKPDTERNIRPDENYARELMQLFSIGLVELNQDGTIKRGIDNAPIPTYDQSTIEHYAHVFTGWHFAPTTEETWYRWWLNYDTESPMTPVEAYHDKAEKTLLSDVIVPANQTAQDDLAMALDSLFLHPNIGPFIGKQLIQKLVTSNPSAGYIARVAAAFDDNGLGVRGDMKAVITAILLDEEARSLDTPDESFGKLREPLIKIAHMMRALDATQEDGQIDLGYPDYFVNQAPQSAPSVFNFFSPSYSTPGELSDNNLVAPELQIMTETYVVRATNYFAYTALWSHSVEDPEPDQLVIDYTEEIAMLDSPQTLLDHLALLFLNGDMSAGMQEALLDVLAETETWKPEDRVANLVFLVLASPQYAVQK